MDGGKMAAPIEASEHDGIEAVRLAAISGLTGNQRWGNHIAVKPVFRENAMQHEPGARRFVASPHGTFLRETAKEAPDVHEITGEFDNLGHICIPLEDSGSDRIKVHI
jgi:hypothetical protein